MTAAEAFMYCGLEIARFFTVNPATELVWDSRVGGAEYWLCWADYNSPVQCAKDTTEGVYGSISAEWRIPIKKGRRFVLLVRNAEKLPFVPYQVLCLVKRQDGTYDHVPLGAVYYCTYDGRYLQKAIIKAIEDDPAWRPMRIPLIRQFLLGE